MLECFGEFNEAAAIWGKGVRHLPAAISFIEQACPHQSMRMLGNIFKVADELGGDLFYGHSVIFFNQLQNCYPPMICRSLEISF